jgi:hypothetical protein
MKTYGPKQTFLFYEAARRFIQFNQMSGKNKTLTEAWTGLGTMSVYQSMYNAGLMIPIRPYYQYCETWWMLTKRGAKVVKKLIADCKGIKGNHIDALVKINQVIDNCQKTGKIKCLDRMD